MKSFAIYRRGMNDPKAAAKERGAEFISGTYGAARGRSTAKPHPLPECRRPLSRIFATGAMHERKKCKKSICDH